VKNGQTASPVHAFECAMEDIRSRISFCGGPLAVAYSGGLDSTALLHLTGDYAGTRGLPLFAFHVHHGLSRNADDWFRHCERECARLGIRFDGQRVRLADVAAHGVEAAARSARYAALGELCRRHGVRLLLTAHHRDDQVETVLLQMLRGSGIPGLSGMDIANTAPALLGDPELVVARPLLGVSRADLAAFVEDLGLPYIEDESNGDPRYARNALRHHVMPALAEYFPGFQRCLARTAGHARSARHLLDALAEQDLAQCRDGDCIDIRRLRLFDAERIDNLLRFWFSTRGVSMPSASRLSEMRTQLLGAKEGAQLWVTHADCEIHRHRGRIYLVPTRTDARVSALSPQPFRWNGETHLRFAAFGGSLHFEPAEQGIDAGWLREQALCIRLRQGGEKIKLAPDRPTRSLKHHYQALDIPAWERLHLPLVTVGGNLLFAAGIGVDWRVQQPGRDAGIRLRWEPEVGTDAMPDF